MSLNMCIIFIHTQICVYICRHVHMCLFFSQLSYLDIDFLELELLEEIIITLQVASPTGTVFHNEQELKVNLDNDRLTPFLDSLIYSICIPCS